MYTIVSDQVNPGCSTNSKSIGVIDLVKVFCTTVVLRCG